MFVLYENILKTDTTTTVSGKNDFQAQYKDILVELQIYFS